MIIDLNDLLGEDEVHLPNNDKLSKEEILSVISSIKLSQKQYDNWRKRNDKFCVGLLSKKQDLKYMVFVFQIYLFYGIKEFLNDKFPYIDYQKYLYENNNLDYKDKELEIKKYYLLNKLSRKFRRIIDKLKETKEEI